jgi:hypothetical protein
MEDKSLAKLLLGYENSKEFIERARPLGWEEERYVKDKALILKNQKIAATCGIVKYGGNYLVFSIKDNGYKIMEKINAFKAFLSLERILIKSL